jgi:hypothetical protein
MKKLFAVLCVCFLAISVYAEDYVDGKLFNEFEISQWDGISAPAVSPTNSARIYYDTTLDYLLSSENGGAYTRLLNLTSGNSTYLKLDGSNANVPINIGSQSFTTTGTLTATGLTDFGSALTGTGTGAEFFKNASAIGDNRIIAISGFAGSWLPANPDYKKWTATMQVDGYGRLVFGGMYSAVFNAGLNMGANKQMSFANSGGFAAVSNLGEAQTTTGIFFTPAAGMRYLAITTGNYFNWGISSPTNPTLYVFSGLYDGTAAMRAAYIRMYHDQTNGVIESGAGAVKLANNTIIGNGVAATDYTLTFDGETNDGLLTWMEDENYFLFGNNVNLGSNTFTTTGTLGSGTHTIGGATGVSMAGALGHLTLTGIGNTNNEALIIDLESNHDRIALDTGAYWKNLHIPSFFLQSAYTNSATAPAGERYAGKFTLDHTANTAETNTQFGIHGTVVIRGSSTVDNIVAISASSLYSGTGRCTNVLTGLNSGATISSGAAAGTIAAMRGGAYKVTNNNADTTVTAAQTILIYSPTNAGTLTDTYGLYIENQVVGTQTNPAYAIKTNGGKVDFGNGAVSTTGTGRFDGGLGIGADPTSRFFINLSKSQNSDMGMQIINSDTAGSQELVMGRVAGEQFVFGVYNSAYATTAYRKAFVMRSDSGMSGGMIFASNAYLKFGIRDRTAGADTPHFLWINDGTGATVADMTIAGAFQIDSNMTIGSGVAATDYTLTFDGETNDGLLTWMEDEDYFDFADAVATTAIKLKASTPSTLTGDVNDWALGNVSFVRAAGGAADRIVTGIAAQSDGHVLFISNVGTTNKISFANDSASSSAANRIYTTVSGTVEIPPYHCIQLIYDSTSSRWREMSHL